MHTVKIRNNNFELIKLMGQNDKSTGYAKTCQSIIYIKGIQNTINNVKTDYSELASEKNIVSTKANFSTFLSYLRNIFIGFGQ
ncbi:MAG TPA: hypothetical protein ACHBX0_07855 [Arsenophonus sp.]